MSSNSNRSRHLQNVYRQHHHEILSQLSNQFSAEDAFQPLNVPNVPMFRRRTTAGNNNNNEQRQHQQGQRQHQQGQRQNDSTSFELYEPCLHERTVYKSPDKVPIQVCDDCQSIVVPETAHSVVARAIPLPLSMQRDERWSQLFDIFEDHRALLAEVDSLLERQERLLIRLYRWREAYSRDTLIDFDGKDNPMFAVLENSVKRTSNATIGFQQTIESILVDSRRRMLKQVSRCTPRTVDEFVRVTKKRLAEAHPTALYHPNAKQMCAVCDEKRCNVLLYSTRNKKDRVADLRSFIFSQSGQCQEASRFCTCKELAICLDCLLKWYWESSEALRKSFAKCPTCRAEFHIEDIFPIYEGPMSSTSASTSVSASHVGQELPADDNRNEHQVDLRSSTDNEVDDEEEEEDDGQNVQVYEESANPFLVGINSVVYEFIVDEDQPLATEMSGERDDSAEAQTDADDRPLV